MISGTALPIRGYVFDRLPALGTGRLRPGVIVGVTAATTALLFVLSQKWVDAITTSLIFGIVLLSIVMVTGFCGQISLGQWALAGMGAFIAARLVAASGVPFELAALIGIVGTVPLGLAFALPAVRTRGVNLAIVTLGLGLAVQAIVFDNSEWNGGIGGTVMGRQTVFGISIDRIDHPEAYGILTLVCFLVVAIMVANVRRGTRGPPADRGAHQRARRGGVGDQHRRRQALRVRARVRVRRARWHPLRVPQPIGRLLHVELRRRLDRARGAGRDRRDRLHHRPAVRVDPGGRARSGPRCRRSCSRDSRTTSS